MSYSPATTLYFDNYRYVIDLWTDDVLIIYDNKTGFSEIFICSEFYKNNKRCAWLTKNLIKFCNKCIVNRAFI